MSPRPRCVYTRTRSRTRPPSSIHTGTERDLPRISQSAISIPATALMPMTPRRQKLCFFMIRTSFSISRGSRPMTRGARSSIAPATERVFHSSVASPHPNKPASSVSTCTKIQFRISACTMTERMLVIFNSKLSPPRRQPPPLACRPARVNRRPGVLSVSARLLLGDDHRRNQQDALRHHLEERGHAGQDQSIVQNANDEDAEQSADDRALAAGQRAPAEDSRRDGFQFKTLGAGDRLSRSGSGREQHSREARGRAAQYVDSDLIGANVETGETRHDRIAADGVNVAAGDGVAHQHEEDRDDDDEYQNRDWQAKNLAVTDKSERGIENADRLTVRDDERDAAEHGHRAEGGDHGVDASDRDDQSVDESGDGSDRDTKQNAEGRGAGPSDR